MEGLQHGTRPREVLIGPQFKPAYAPPPEQGTDLGVKDWPPDAWKNRRWEVCGVGVTYDAELDALYHGTGNPGPWNAEQRPGDNKWTGGYFRARSGQWRGSLVLPVLSPHEHDYDGINEQILLDMPFGGKMTKVLVHLDRQWLCLCDRASHREGVVGRSLRCGEFLARRRSRNREAHRQSRQADQARRGNP